MSSKLPPGPAPTRDPVTLTLDTALHRSEPLTRLRERLRDSAARLQAIQPLLPPALRAHVQAGPVDETGWTLLLANAAVAAKLRQLKPRLEARLAEQGWTEGELRLKVLGSAP